MNSFLETFYSLIHPGDTVLDLGAGKGIHALKMAEKGATVITLEKNRMEDHVHSQSIHWQFQNIRDWVKENKEKKLYDLILMRNLVQFCDKEWAMNALFPVLEEILKQGGVLGIETFFKPPEPPFPKLHHSYWTTDELQDAFSNLEMLFSQTTEEERKDQSGTPRKFFISNVILKK